MSETPGAVALVGSGEYTDAMLETDRWLIETIGGPAQARVALLPTASGLEANGPTYWNDLGQQHFAKLGISDVRSTWILNDQSANDAEQLALLRDANFYYFSGGNPNHLINSLRDSPAWEIIHTAYLRGAVMAGCSAGAMAMSHSTIALRLAWGEGPLSLVDALNVVPQVMVFPHFDRIIGRMGRAALKSRLMHVPTTVTPIGVDEDTALVSVHQSDAAPDRWRVMGRQTVTIFWHGRDPQVLHAGEEIELA